VTGALLLIAQRPDGQLVRIRFDERVLGRLDVTAEEWKPLEDNFTDLLVPGDGPRMVGS
jgi:hypothetical protein